jgi:hypothetical protein
VKNAADSAPVRLMLVELMGPAGAGKSTIFEGLLDRDPTILVAPTLRHSGYAPLVATNLLKAGATLVRRRAIESEDPREQLRVMMYVQAVPRVLPGLGSADDTALVFDQGPLLDIVVALDAPDDLLRERINTREKWHALKGADDSALDTLRASRKKYERTLEALAARPVGPAVLRFDTSTHSADEIADAILSAMRGGTTGDARAERARREP